MAPRPNWKGFLKLSLVSCPVALYSATSTSQRIRFNIINKKTGNRVHNQVVDAETEEPGEEDEIYLDEDYYIAPTDKVGTEAFAVIREAMKKEDLVGIARVVLYRRERILMLAPRGDGIMATALRY